MPYFEFSNFALFPVFIDDWLWSTTEHYYQASKFERDSDIYLKIRNCKAPATAAKYGRENKIIRPQDWNDKKDNVMYIAVKAKFDQHEHLKETLLNTGDALIVEHRRADSYWGDGGDGTGLNMLGLIIMCLRHEYRNEKKEKHELVCDIFKEKFGDLLVKCFDNGVKIKATVDNIDNAMRLPSTYLGEPIEIEVIREYNATNDK